MNFGLECKKMKRTGFFTAFLCGGLLSAAVPVLNMAVRSENYLGIDALPVQILMDANWQLMSMLNILLTAAVSCLMYHTEYADGAIQRIRSLPLRESRLYFGKAALMMVMCIVILILEAAGMAFCLHRWFELSADARTELLKSFGYALLLMLPAVLSSLLIASACKNIWVSLGVNVICIFTATMLPAKNFVLSLFPFALPFRIFSGASENIVPRFLTAALIEIVVIGTAEILYLKLRRLFT